jgi:acetylornithine deacetylase/succinyl-diaminopimelate desuccinylase-like protein
MARKQQGVPGATRGRRRTSAARPAALLALAGVVLSATPGMAEDPASIRDYVTAHQGDIVRRFASLLAMPSVASDTTAIRQNAELIAAELARRGVEARLLENDGPPIVFGELRTPGARRTVAIYAHYDGQPVDEAQWTTPPWSPVVRKARIEAGGEIVPLEALGDRVPGEWWIYARSAGDDKAPIAAILTALDAVKATGVRPTVDVKLFFEGEEEAGSPHLREIVEANRELLAADVWLLCDGPVHQSRRMQLYFGARGVQGLELTVYGPLRALHSGHYGNWAPNPAVELVHLLASLRDTEGHILIPGFYADVRPPSQAERRAARAAPEVDAALREELGLADTEGKFSLAEAILEPALNVRGIEAGHVGERATNAIPTQARASIDFRLVPDQTPEAVRRRVEDHLRALGYTLVDRPPDHATRLAYRRLVRLEWDSGYPAARTDLELPVSRALARVVSDAVGAPVVQVPTLGGSVPMYLFQELLGVPVVGVPVANHDNNQHAGNENLRLQNLRDAIQLFAALLARLGRELP